MGSIYGGTGVNNEAKKIILSVPSLFILLRGMIKMAWAGATADGAPPRVRAQCFRH